LSKHFSSGRNIGSETSLAPGIGIGSMMCFVINAAGVPAEKSTVPTSIS
jgi:hypothetical protein